MGYCRARLTPFGRKLLVDRILELGWPVAQAAESVGVSRQTAYRWMRRFQEEGKGRSFGSFFSALSQSRSGLFGHGKADRFGSDHREGKPSSDDRAPGRTAFHHLRGARPSGIVPPPAIWTEPPAHRSAM